MFQKRFLYDQSPFRGVVKARQIGLSTVISIETTHAACTRSEYNANIISVNQEEASSKLRVSSSLWASIPDAMIPLGFKPIKFRDAEDALAFHDAPHTSTIISKPGTHAVRGGAKSIYFDEAAFIEKFKQLYQAGAPAALRGDNRVTVISTPLGESGLYHEIITDRDKYPDYTIHIIPWWESMYMVREGAQEDAIALAPTMGTEQRVYEFGNPKLIGLYKNTGDIQTFQTEMECMFVDETEAFLTWDLVTASKDETLKNDKHFQRTSGDEISIGVDLAKKRDQTVFTVVQHLSDAPEGSPKWRIRYVYQTQDNYDKQFDDLKKLVLDTGARRVSIDETGVGQIFVERAKREGLGSNVRVEGISFTHEKKENWATKMKADLQQGRGKYVPHTELMRQFHGIRRKKSETGFYRFTGDPDDIFWSSCLGVYGEGSVPVRFHVLG
jgi:phage FluMu gp28-like protein